MQAPARHVEEAQAFFALSQSIAALDSAAPPFAEVPPGAERHQFVLVRQCPQHEAVVVASLRREPSRARADVHLAVFGDEDLCVGAVDFLGDDALTREPCDLRELLKFG